MGWKPMEDSGVETYTTRPKVKRWRKFALWFLVLAAGIWLYLRPFVLEPGTATSRNPQGFYGLLTAGFRSGHLYLALEPSPMLATLANPYDPVANAPYRAHDMTYIHGHYYMYFGPAPAVLFFWPWVWLTGRYPSEALAVGFFLLAAASLAVAVLLDWRRRYFPQAPFIVLCLAAFCCVGATPALFLAQSVSFYQVPVACSYFLQMVMFAALYRAFRNGRCFCLWVGLASLAYGLTVAARPDCLFGGVAVLIVALTQGVRLASVRRALVAAVVPAAICGALLLWYNHARFGSFGEFGMRYQLAGENYRQLQPFLPKYVIPHLRAYMFGPAGWSIYFPFIMSRGDALPGQFLYNPWLWPGLAAVAAVGVRQVRDREDCVAIYLWAVAAAAVANLVFLSSFFWVTRRYPNDFMAGFVLLGGLGSVALTGEVRFRHHKFVRRGIFAAGFAALAINLLLYSRFGEQTPVLLKIARVANWPAAAWNTFRGQKSGVLRMTVRLPERPGTEAEPVMQTGNESDQRDWVQISYPAPDFARLEYFHAGTGLMAGQLFAVPADRTVVIQMQTGALLPPFSAREFAGVPYNDWLRMSHQVILSANGLEVLRAAVTPYPTTPGNVVLGRLVWPGPGVGTIFNGQILEVKQDGIKLPLTPAISLNEGPVQLGVRFSFTPHPQSEPLLSVGTGGGGDLLYCHYISPYEVSLGFDHQGSQELRSLPVPIDLTREHTLQISLRNQSTVKNENVSVRRLVVIFDGATVLNADVAADPAGGEICMLGLNTAHHGVASPEFSGEIRFIRKMQSGEIATKTAGATYGILLLNVMLPPGEGGQVEPIVVTGRTGAGDILYLKYIDADHAAVGYDHWGVGGATGKVFAIDRKSPHHFSVMLPSIDPGATGDSGRAHVLFDNQVVFEARVEYYPSRIDEIQILQNQIGASTCGPVFTGKILSIESGRVPAN